MDPNTNPAPAQPQPIQDVVPPHDSLGNPENFKEPVASPPPADHINRSSAPRPSANPIAGTALAQSQMLRDGPVDDHGLDGVLKDVTSNIKAGVPAPTNLRPPKKGFFGFLKKKPKAAPLTPPHSPPRPPQPNQVQQAHNQQISSSSARQPAKHPLKSGPVQPKKKGRISLPAVVAVVVALVLVVVAFSAFKK